MRLPEQVLRDRLWEVERHRVVEVVAFVLVCLSVDAQAAYRPIAAPDVAWALLEARGVAALADGRADDAKLTPGVGAFQLRELVRVSGLEIGAVVRVAAQADLSEPVRARRKQ